MTSNPSVFATVPASVEVLTPFVDAGVFNESEVHFAATIGRLAGGVGEAGVGEAGVGEAVLDDAVLLALAVAARAPRSGHVCVELGDAHRLVLDLPARAGADAGSELEWPEPAEWAARLRQSPVVAEPSSADEVPLRPLVLDGQRLYLHRLWTDELRVAAGLVERARVTGGFVDPGARDAALDATFGPGGTTPDLQRAAAELALDGALTVVVGGPGTGKTRTIARLIAAAHLSDTASTGLQVALAAPTGKAAARMTDAVHSAVDQLESDATVPTVVLDELRSTEATTIHRLLGRRPGGGFRHDAHRPLPHDLVVIDETSMVALPLMARLLDALRPDARLVFVGDPDQLASVEAGTVLADMVAEAHDAAGPLAGPLAGRIVELSAAHRFRADSGIAALAAAISAGDDDEVVDLLESGRSDLSWVRPEDDVAVAALESQVIDAGVALVDAARAGDPVVALAAARSMKVLAATRHRRFGLRDWSTRIERGVADRVPALGLDRRWYVGQPVMLTANDALTRVANGDTGVVVAEGERTAVALDTGGEPRLVPTARLDRVESWWAMTIHKSQGSEFAQVVVSLPEDDSPILTRELLYTAATRARESLVLVASEASLRRAVQRPVARASGLRDRLWGPDAADRAPA